MIMLSTSGQEWQYADQVQKAKALFEEYEDFIQQVICRRFPAEAEDLFQDFFLMMVNKPVPDYVEDIKGYLYRSIVHDITDWLRQNTRRRTNLRKYIAFKAVRGEGQCFLKTFANQNEAEYILDLAKKHLPAYLFRVLRLRFQESLDIPKIADVIGTSPRSVSVYLSNAIRRTRELVNEHALLIKDQPDECLSSISD